MYLDGETYLKELSWKAFQVLVGRMTSADQPDTHPAFRAPFDDDDADLIIHSSDDVAFRVYKVIVTKSSPVIRAMLRDGAQSRDPKTITLPETSATIEVVLGLCYPGLDPQVVTLDAVQDLVHFCKKYEMEGIMKRAARFFATFRKTYPLRLYAIAWQAGLEDEVRKAAFRCLYNPIGHILYPDPKTLQDLPVAAYQDLLRYHFSCSQEAAAVLQSSDFRWAGTGFGKHMWTGCRERGCMSAENVTYDQLSTTYGTAPGIESVTATVPLWWKLWMTQLAVQLFNQAVLPPNDSIAPCESIPCHPCKLASKGDFADFLPKLLQRIKSSVLAVSALNYGSIHHFP